MIPDLFTSFLFSFHLVPGEFYSFLLLDPLFSETRAPPLRNGRSPPLTTEEQDRELQPQEVLNSYLALLFPSPKRAGNLLLSSYRDSPLLS